MIQYKDYFSRRELFYLGIDSEKEIEELSKNYNGEKRNDDIESEMKNIYRFIKASQEKLLLNEPAMITSKNILHNQVSKRIISAFYDVGILDDLDLERFPLDYKLDEPTKMQITVSEALEDEAPEINEIEATTPSKDKKLC
jgi:hypothetical protein